MATKTTDAESSPGAETAPAPPERLSGWGRFCALLDGVFGSRYSHLELELANQKIDIPLNVWLAVILCGAFLSFSSLDLSSRGMFTRTIATALFSIETNGVSKSDIESQIYEFWTPSPGTLKSIETYDAERYSALTPEQREWYTVESDEVVRRFGDRLVELGAQGFSYFDSTGRGTGPYKDGYVWEVTFGPQSTITPERFIHLYKEYFKRDKRVYLKIATTGRTRVSLSEVTEPTPR